MVASLIIVGEFMSKKRDDLIDILVEYFYTYKSYDLCDAMKSYGLIPDETLNPNNSKRIFAKAGIKMLSDEDIEKLTLRIAKEAEENWRIFLIHVQILKVG